MTTQRALEILTKASTEYSRGGQILEDCEEALAVLAGVVEEHEKFMADYLVLSNRLVGAEQETDRLRTTMGELRQQGEGQKTLILAMKGHHPSVDKLAEENAALKVERDELKHIIECENTPLMADVLKERDDLKAEFLKERRHAQAAIWQAAGYKARAEKAEAELSALRSEAEAARPLLGIRPEVVAFARLMEDRLQANEHKGGWKGCRLDWLLGRLKEEVAELEFELGSSVHIWVDKEAADVGNFAMMITDVVGRLAYRAGREGKETK